jgi:hypothetical protein
MKFVGYAVIAWVVLTVFATVYAASANPRDVRVLSKPIWIVLCVFVPVFGALLYLTIGRPLDNRKPTTTIAPDDDPDFLRRLAEQLKEDDEDEDPEKPKGAK